jgi:hypothetical protein
MTDTCSTAQAHQRKAGVDDLTLAWDAQAVIDLLDTAATETLRAHNFDSWPRMVAAPEHIQAATGRSAFPVYAMPAQTPERAQHAARVLEVLRVVRGFLYSSGSLNDAVILGMRLGVAVEQAGLADLVPLAKRPVRLTPEASDQVQILSRPACAVSEFKEG